MGKCINKAFGNKHPEQDYWSKDQGQREEKRPDIWTKYESATKDKFLQDIKKNKFASTS